jgi:isocitrate dehydrogenase (NAD+)
MTCVSLGACRPGRRGVIAPRAMSERVTLIPGDGIGPEVTAAAQAVIAAAGVSITWDVCAAGGRGGGGDGQRLSRRAHRVHSAQPHRAQGPRGYAHRHGLSQRQRHPAPRPGLVRLRAPGAVHPRDSYPLRRRRPGGGARKHRGPVLGPRAHAWCPAWPSRLKIVTERACLRIARVCVPPRWRATWAGSQVTALHKANIMKLSDGLFLDVRPARCRGDYPEVATQEMPSSTTCCDAASCAKPVPLRRARDGQPLRRHPERTSAAGLVGGLGVVPGSQHRRRVRGLRSGPRQRAGSSRARAWRTPRR